MGGGKGNKVGTPQGGVISPLLANICLNLVDKLVREHSAFKDVHIVGYANDFVLMRKNMDNSRMRENRRYGLTRGLGEALMRRFGVYSATVKK